MEHYAQFINCLIDGQNDKALKNLKLAKPILDQVKYYELKLKVISDDHLKYKKVEKMTFLNNIDFNVRNYYLNLLSNYIEPLPFTTKLKLNCPTFFPYLISTPCIKKINEELYCNMRAINYTYTKEGDYIARDPDHIVRTINYIVKLDNDYLIQDSFLINEDANLTLYPHHVLGMEDIRLINDSYFLCTRLDVTPDHRPKMCLCQYNRADIISTKILDYNNMGVEKNWLPLLKDDECKIIYGFQPLTIYNLDLESGELTPYLTRHLSNKNLSTFRGSAVPIFYNDGWLMTVHQVYYHKLRKYYHRFVWLSNNFDEIKISKAFYFDKIGVEFNLGLEQNDNEIILTYSIDDNRPTLLTINKSIVDELLKI